MRRARARWSADRKRRGECNALVRWRFTMTKAFATLLLLAACQSSMREPPPLRTLAPKVTQQRSADELVAAANTAWSQRGEAGEAAAAQDAYLAAAALDPHRT